MAPCRPGDTDEDGAATQTRRNGGDHHEAAGGGDDDSVFLPTKRLFFLRGKEAAGRKKADKKTLRCAPESHLDGLFLQKTHSETEQGAGETGAESKLKQDETARLIHNTPGRFLLL